MRWTWALWRGLDSDLVAQNYMITKKLTFNLRFKLTRKIFPNYVLGKKQVSNTETVIIVDSFLVIVQKPGPVLSPNAQYRVPY